MVSKKDLNDDEVSQLLVLLGDASDEETHDVPAIIHSSGDVKEEEEEEVIVATKRRLYRSSPSPSTSAVGSEKHVSPTLFYGKKHVNTHEKLQRYNYKKIKKEEDDNPVPVSYATQVPFPMGPTTGSSVRAVTCKVRTKTHWFLLF